MSAQRLIALLLLHLQHAAFATYHDAYHWYHDTYHDWSVSNPEMSNREWETLRGWEKDAARMSKARADSGYTGPPEWCLAQWHTSINGYYCGLCAVFVLWFGTSIFYCCYRRGLEKEVGVLDPLGPLNQLDSAQAAGNLLVWSASFGEVVSRLKTMRQVLCVMSILKITVGVLLWTFLQPRWPADCGGQPDTHNYYTFAWYPLVCIVIGLLWLWRARRFHHVIQKLEAAQVPGTTPGNETTLLLGATNIPVGIVLGSNV